MPCCRKHILTGSFDKKARVWDAETGDCVQTLWGHSGEVVSAKFGPDNQLVATASMDNTSRVYSTTSGECQLVALALPKPFFDKPWIET